MAVGSERGYWILDLHPKASRNADLRGRPNGTERIPVSRLLRLIWVRELDGASPSATACRSHSTPREDRRSDDPADDNEESYRFILQKNFPAQPRKRWKHSFPPRRVSGRNRYGRLSKHHRRLSCLRFLYSTAHACAACKGLPPACRSSHAWRPSLSIGNSIT